MSDAVREEARHLGPIVRVRRPHREEEAQLPPLLDRHDPVQLLPPRVEGIVIRRGPCERLQVAVRHCREVLPHQRLGWGFGLWVWG